MEGPNPQFQKEYIQEILVHVGRILVDLENLENVPSGHVFMKLERYIDILVVDIGEMETLQKLLQLQRGPAEHHVHNAVGIELVFAASVAFVVEIVQLALAGVELMNVVAFQRNARVAFVHSDREFVLYVLNRQILPNRFKLFDDIRIFHGAFLPFLEQELQTLLQNLLGSNGFRVRNGRESQILLLQALGSPYYFPFLTHAFEVEFIGSGDLSLLPGGDRCGRFLRPGLLEGLETLSPLLHFLDFVLGEVLVHFEAFGLFLRAHLAL